MIWRSQELDSNFLTSSSEVVMLGNGGMGDPLHSGTWDRFSLVKTD